MKYSATFILLLLIVLGCSNSNSEDISQDGITISGTVDNPKDGLILLKAITNTSFETLDTISLKDDKTFSFMFDGEPGFYRIDFFGAQAVTLILDDSNIELNVDGTNPRGKFEVKGSPEYDQIIKFNTHQQSVFGEQIGRAHV